MAREKESKLDRLFRFRTLREALCQLCMEKMAKNCPYEWLPCTHTKERERERVRKGKRESESGREREDL